MFYIMLEEDSKDACFASDDDYVPKSFATEDSAVSEAKSEANDYCGDILILRAVGRVTEKTTYECTKIK